MKDKEKKNVDSQEDVIEQDENLEEDENLENGESETEETEESTEETEVEDEETEEEQEEEKEETVPLKTYLDIKKKYKDLRRAEEKRKEKEMSKGLKDKKEAIVKKWLDKGFDEATANMIAEENTSIYEEIEKLKSLQTESYLDEDIDDLVLEYPEAKEYRAQIKSKMKKYERNGDEITAEEAYLLISGTKGTIRDRKTKEQQIEIVRNKNKSGKKTNVLTSPAGKKQNPYELDKDDLKALKNLQKAQPGAKWTAKKYYNMMKK